MKKTIFTLVAVLIFGFYANAQNFINAYTNKTGSANTGFMSRVAIDNMNNVTNSTTYTTSIIVGGTTFTSNGTTSSIIVKRDDNDSIIWAKSLSCGKNVFVSGLYADQQSNVYVMGFFGDSLSATTLNCDPYPISLASGVSLFVIKYAPNGNVLWSNSIKIALSTSAPVTELLRITGNGTNRIAITSPIIGVPNQTVGSSTISASTGSLFYALIDDNGNWLHATVLGGSPLHMNLSIAMADNEDIFIAGEFRGTLNLGGAGTLSTLTSSPQDFIVKANAAGSFVWAKMLESSSWWRTEVLTDHNDVLLFGCFNGSTTMGTTLSSSTYSTYISKINNAGSFLWAKKYGAYESHFYCATKNNNRIYLTGYTSPSFPSNQFDTLNLTYATSLSPSHTYSCVCYLLETDLDGNALKGAAYSFDFATLNTQNMTCNNSRVFLTGNVGSIAAFGGHVLSTLQTNSANYVAQFTDSANMITGKTFYDLNANTLFDGADSYCPAKLTLTKAGNAISTVVNGTYQVGVDKGTYVSTITDAPLYYTYTPLSYTSIFAALNNQIDSLNNFAFQPIPNQNDLVIDLVTGAFRPGFTGIAHVTLKNVGTTTKSGSMNVLLNHPNITISSCIPAATNITGNAATLAYNLNPTQQISYVVEYAVDLLATIGSNVVASASAPDVSDLTPANNSDTVHRVISASYDPNEKEVYPKGNIPPSFIANGDVLEYIVNFQNTGTDTAFTVIVTDSISQKLNLSTFKLISSSYPVTVNFYDKEVWFRFYNINLPDSSTNQALSHGFVKYSIKPMSNCVLGDSILNKAYIFFDYNAPIITNTTSTHILNPVSVKEIAAKDQTAIYPNPSNGSSIRVTSSNPMTSVEIYDALGQKLQTTSANHVSEMHIAVDGLRTGVYFINIITDKTTTTHKFIKIN